MAGMFDDLPDIAPTRSAGLFDDLPDATRGRRRGNRNAETSEQAFARREEERRIAQERATAEAEAQRERDALIASDSSINVIPRGVAKLGESAILGAGLARDVLAESQDSDAVSPWGILMRRAFGGAKPEETAGILKAEEIRQDFARSKDRLFPKPRAQEQAERDIAQADGVLGTLGALVRNPLGSAQLAGESLASSLPAVRAAGVIAGSGLASSVEGANVGDEVEAEFEALRASPMYETLRRTIGEENLRKAADQEKARRIQQTMIGAGLGGAATAGLTSRIGLNPIDEVIAGRTGALSSRVPNTLKELGGEFIEGAGTQASVNLLTGDDIGEDVLKSGVTESALGGLTAVPFDVANVAARPFRDADRIGDQVRDLVDQRNRIDFDPAIQSDLARQQQARDTTQRVIGASDEQTATGALAADRAIAEARAARPTVPQTFERDQLIGSDEVDRLLTGGINEQAQTATGRNVPDGQDAGRAAVPVPGYGGGLPAGVRASYPGDSRSAGEAVGFVGDGSLGSRDALRPAQFTELGDGTVFVPGDPVAIRQRLADAGVEGKLGVARTHNGVPGVRFGKTTRDVALGVLGGADVQRSVALPSELAGRPAAVSSGSELGAGGFGLEGAQRPQARGMVEVPDSEANRGLAQPAQAEAAVDVPPALRDLTDREREVFSSLENEIEQATSVKGGTALVDENSQVTHRLGWTPMEEGRDFWRGRPTQWTAKATLRALEKARNGEELTAQQQNIVDYARQWSRQYASELQAKEQAGIAESRADAIESARGDILAGMQSVADESPAQRSSAQSLGSDYTARLLNLMTGRKAGMLNPAEQEEYVSLLELDRETGKVDGRPMPDVGNKTGYVDALLQGRLKPVQVFTDADQFKKVNDVYGHAVGDEVIRLYGRAMVEAFGKGHNWHRGGDEFLGEADSEAEADAAMARVAEYMRNIRLEVQLSDGRTAVLEGIGVSYGKGATEQEADEGLKRDKERRKRLGLRADREDADSRSVDSEPGSARAETGGADSRRGPEQPAAAEGVGGERQAQTDVVALVNGRGAANGSGRDSANRGNGQAQSRVGRETGGIDAALSELTAALGSKFTRRLTSQPWFNLVDSVAALPADVRKSITEPDTAAGFVLPDGRVFVIAGNIQPGDVAGVVLHEVGVHFGLSSLPDFPSILRDFKRLRAKDGKVAHAYERAESVADRDENGELTKAARELLDEEAFAYFIEANWNAKTPLMTRIMDAVAMLLNRLGVPMSRIDDALKRQALRGMIAKARAAAEDAASGRISVRDGKLAYHKAWHGSPHDFDEFRLDDSTIGTGEGAQAFGHGLYFAGRRELGEYYRETLTNRDPNGYALAHLNAKNIVARMGGDAEWAAEVISDQLSSTDESDPNYQRLTDTLAIIKSGEYAKPLKNTGRLYEVELAPDESDYLDWDAPLSEQSSKVQQSVYNLLTDLGVSSTVANYYASSKSGADVYREISRLAGGDKAASTRLRSERVPGIRYLDGSSRGGKAGWRVKFKNGQYSGKVFDTKAEADAAVERGEYNMVDRVEKIDDLSHNYVIFDDSLVKVQAKYSRRPDTIDVDGPYALRTVAAGDSVDGRIVRDGVPNQSSIASSLDDYTILKGIREVPMDAFDKEYVESIAEGRIDKRTQDLADAISASKEIAPLIVAYDADGAYIIEGGHRFDALIKIGAKSLPAMVVIDESNPPNQSPTDSRIAYSRRTPTWDSTKDAATQAADLTRRARLLSQAVTLEKGAIGNEADKRERIRKHGEEANRLIAEFDKLDALRIEKSDADVDLRGLRTMAARGDRKAIRDLEQAVLQRKEVEDEIAKAKAAGGRAAQLLNAIDRTQLRDVTPMISALQSFSKALGIVEDAAEKARKLRDWWKSREQAYFDAFETAKEKRGEAAVGLGVQPPQTGAIGYTPTKLGMRWEGAHGVLRRRRRELQDQFISWRDVQGDIAKAGGLIDELNDVYTLENLMHGRTADQLRRGEDAIIKPLQDVMVKHGIRVAELEDYLEAVHAKPRNASVRKVNPKNDSGSGMTDAEADAYLAGTDAGHRSKSKLTAERKKQLQEAEVFIRQLVQKARDRLLETGVITKEMHAALSKDDTYVPLRHIEKSAEGDDAVSGDHSLPGIGSGLDVRSHGVKRALGRTTRAENILGEVIGNWQRAVILGEKNRVGQAILRMALQNPIPGVMEAEKVETELKYSEATGQAYMAAKVDTMDPNTIAIFVDGKRYHVKLEERLARAAKRLNAEPLGKILSGLHAVNRVLANLYTSFSLTFALVNPIRDLTAGLARVAGDKGVKIAADAAANWIPARAAIRANMAGRTGGEWTTLALPTVSQATRAKWVKYADEATKAGFMSGFTHALRADAIQDSMVRRLKNAEPGAFKMTARGAKAVLDYVQDVNQANENAFRLATYVALREAGETAQAAAQFAKNVTVNFNRKGELSAKIGAYSLFFNAAVQGSHAVVQTLKSKKVMAAVATVSAAAAALAFMGMDDRDEETGERYWDLRLTDSDKQRNFIIPTGGGDFIKIPLPYGLNVFPYTAVKIAEGIRRSMEGEEVRTAETVGSIGAAAANSFMPVDLNLLSAFPTAVRPIAEARLNENFFGSEVHPDEAYDKYETALADKYFPGTSAAAIALADAARWVGTLGDTSGSVKPWFPLDWSPNDLEYMAAQYTGGPGKMFSGVVDATLDVLAGGAPSRDNPMNLANVVMTGGRNPDREVSGRYRERSEMFARLVDQGKDIYAAEGRAAWREFQDKHKQYIGGVELHEVKKAGEKVIEARKSDDFAEAFKDAEREIRKLRAEKRQAYNDQSIGLIDRKRRTEAIDKEIAELQKEALRDFNSRR